MDEGKQGLDAMPKPSGKPTLLGFIAAAWVVMLVLSAFTYWVYITYSDVTDDDGNGDGGPFPWLVPADVRTINQTETWTGRTGVLDQPVRVEAGAKLTLEDCDITVMLEDLVFWRRPAFEVEEGGSLEVVGSTVTLHRDPRLERSVVGWVWEAIHSVPHIARRVNLAHATEPVLHFDVSWRHEATPLAVAVVGGLLEALQVLRVVEPPEPGELDWTHVEVPLTGYAGAQPWVVLFSQERPSGLTFVGNATVLDGGKVPEGDAFPTGHPMRDGWYVDGFADLDHVMSVYHNGSHYSRGWGDLWRGLVEADGDVTITNSQVLAPGNLSRKANREFHKEEVDPDEVLSVTQIGCQGGHVSVDDARLEITGSRLEYVPVLSNRSEVLMDGVDLVGDGDVLSLLSPHGSIRSTSVTYTTPGYKIPFEYHDGRYLWGIAVEGTSPAGPLDIRDTVIEGFELGLDLSHAHVTLEDCEFRSIEHMPLWDHASTGVGDWDDIRSKNTFTQCENFKYLRTDQTVVVFTHDEVPDDEIDIWSGTPLQFGLDLYVPIQGSLEFFHGNTARFMAPRVLVTGYNEVQETEELRWRLSWEGEEESISWEPGTTSLQVDLSELFDDTPEPPQEEANAHIKISDVDPLDHVGPGSFRFDFSVIVSNLDALEATLDIDLDGELVRSIVLFEEGNYTYPKTFYAYQVLELTPGPHTLNLAMRGRLDEDDGNYSQEWEEIGNLTQSLVLLSDGDSVDPWVPIEVDHVLLDTGAEVDLGRITQRGVGQPSIGIDLVGGNGTRADIDCSDIEGTPTLDLYLTGEVSVNLSNGNFYRLNVGDHDFFSGDHSYKGSSVSINNISCTFLSTATDGRDAHILDSRIDGRLYLYGWFCKEVSIVDTNISKRGALIDIYNTSLSVRDCTFISDGVRIDAYGNVSIDFSDCSFDDAYLLVEQSGYSYSLDMDINVTGCTFSGPDAILYLGWDLSSMDSYDQDPSWTPAVNGTIEDNNFSEGADVLLHHGLCTRLLGANTMEEGSRVYAMFITRLQVIPPETTPVNHGFTIVESEEVLAYWPFDIWRWFMMDGEVLLDVTDDLSRELDPPSVPVLLESLFRDRMIVRGFSTIELDEDNDEATFPLIPDFENLLPEHVEGWPWR